MMLDLYKTFDACFSLYCKGAFQKYVEPHKAISKWMIFSDFCLGDIGKPNDSISYVFVPYIAKIEKFEELAQKYLPQDFKKIKAESIGLDFLNSPIFFSVTVLLGKSEKLLVGSDGTTREELYAAFIRNSVVKIQNPVFRQKLEQMGGKKNFKLIDRISLTAFFTAYFANLLMQFLPKVEKIGWFADRDNITTAYNEIIYDISHRLFADFSTIPVQSVFNFGKGEKEGAMWYDGLNRFPDYLAGTVADFDIVKSICSGEKQKKILTGVFAVNERHIIVGFRNRRFSRIQLGLK